MNTFERYFIHFFIICSVIGGILISLLALDDSDLISPVSLIIALTCILIYSIPMAIFYSSKSKLVTVQMIVGQGDVKLIEERIASLLKDKYKRTNIKEFEEKKVFQSKEKYKSWLMNEAYIEYDNEALIACIPKQYLEDIKEISRFRVID